tara:strand:+ start:603 stop:1163 length:561 start_codon:yes stop_codon:yes gene_type:complete
MSDNLSVTMEVKGLKEALKTINSIDKKLRREIGKEIKAIGERTVVQAINQLIPSGSPTRGMDHRGRTGWNAKNQVVKVKTNTRNARRRNINQGANYESVGVVTVGTSTAAMAIADMAGKAGNAKSRGGKKARPNFSKELDAKLGAPSRMVWEGGLRAIPEFQNELKPVIARVMYLSNQELAKRGGF